MKGQMVCITIILNYDVRIEFTTKKEKIEIPTNHVKIKLNSQLKKTANEKSKS